MKRGAVNLLVALVLSCAIAVWVVQDRSGSESSVIGVSTAELPYGPLSDRVVNMLDGLRDDGVHVTPDARSMVDAEGARRIADQIRRTARRTGVQVYVVVARSTHDAGASGFGLDQQLEHELEKQGDQAVVLIWQGPQEGNTQVIGGGYLRDISYLEDFVGDPATTLTELVTQVPDQVTWTGASTQEDSDTPEAVLGAVLGVIYGLGALLALLLLWALLRRAGVPRLPGSWGWGTPARDERKR